MFLFKNATESAPSANKLCTLVSWFTSHASRWHSTQINIVGVSHRWYFCKYYFWLPFTRTNFLKWWVPQYLFALWTNSYCADDKVLENFLGLSFFGVAPVQLASRNSWKGLRGLSFLLGGIPVGTVDANLTNDGVSGTFSLFDDDIVAVRKLALCVIRASLSFACLIGNFSDYETFPQRPLLVVCVSYVKEWTISIPLCVCPWDILSMKKDGN